MKTRRLEGGFRNRETGQNQAVWLHSVSDVAELEPYLPSLVDCYKDVFSGPPYNEDYSGQEETFIIPAFRSFAQEGVLVLLVTRMDIRDDGAMVIGFGGSIGADKSEAADFLNANADELEVPVSRYLYMAEVGVLSAFRRQGLGTLLVEARIETAVFRCVGGELGFSHLLMRTADEGSNSRSIYERLGATVIPNLIQKKDGFDTDSTSRIFLSRLLNPQSA